MTYSRNFILSYSEVEKEDTDSAGIIGVKMGGLKHAGLPIVDGFIISSAAYFQFIKENNLAIKIKHLLSNIDPTRPESIQDASYHIKNNIKNSSLNEKFIEDVFNAYKRLGGLLKNCNVTIIASPSGININDLSDNLPYSVIQNINGEANVLIKIKDVWSSCFETKAIIKRIEKKESHFTAGIAIVIQKEVHAEKSGYIFTTDPVSTNKNMLIIEAILGMPVNKEKDLITPDHYEIDKKELMIVKKIITKQAVMLKHVNLRSKKIAVSGNTGTRQKITDTEILALAKIGKKLEHHFYYPQQCAWATEKGKIYIIQTKPVTLVSDIVCPGQDSKLKTSDSQLLASGTPASRGIICGPVAILHSIHDINKIHYGDIIITKSYQVEFLPAVRQAAALVTEAGGNTSPMAIISREFGKPAVFGVDGITKKIKNGQIITVNGTTGEIYKGGIYSGSASGNGSDYILPQSTATKLYVDIDNTDKIKNLPDHVDGVGIFRPEQIISKMGIHPKKLINDGQKELFIKTLSSQLEMCLKSFHPKPVIYCFSDMMTYEYKKLSGGKSFEPNEINPILGYHGAFRFIHDIELYKLELEVIKTLRNKMNLKNIWLMMPYVRNDRELIEIKRLLSAANIHRSPTLKLLLSVSIPGNLILLDRLIKTGIDGIVIDSEKLAVLISGTDKDNDDLAPAFDIMNEAVLWAYKKIITIANENSMPSSIFGHSAIITPSLIEKLVAWGITSITVSPDAIDTARKTISEAEQKLLS